MAKVLEFQLQHQSFQHPALISFRIDWLDLHAVQGTLKSLLQHHSSKASTFQHSAFFISLKGKLANKFKRNIKEEYESVYILSQNISVSGLLFFETVIQCHILSNYCVLNGISGIQEWQQGGARIEGTQSCPLTFLHSNLLVCIITILPVLLCASTDFLNIYFICIQESRHRAWAGK